MISILVLLFAHKIIGKQCLVCEGDACTNLTESQCRSNSNCAYLAGCCQTDLCNAVVNALQSQIPSEYSTFVNPSFLCGMGGLAKYCKFANGRCALNDCYQKETYDSSTCPSETCSLGNCPVGKIFPDGADCCNPKDVTVPDCYGDGTKTAGTCTEVGCSFYSGNCFPDLCNLIPTEINAIVWKIDTAPYVEGFCVKDTTNNVMKQDPCYSYSPDKCYPGNDDCYFANGSCPFDVLSGQSTSGCCARITSGFYDKSSCANINNAGSCTAPDCEWRGSLNKCAINPAAATTSGTSLCKLEEVKPDKPEPDKAVFNTAVSWLLLLVISMALLEL